MIKTGKDIIYEMKLNEDPRHKKWIVKEVPELSNLKSGDTSIKSENIFGLYRKQDILTINRED